MGNFPPVPPEEEHLVESSPDRVCVEGDEMRNRALEEQEARLQEDRGNGDDYGIAQSTDGLRKSDQKDERQDEGQGIDQGAADDP